MSGYDKRLAILYAALASALESRRYAWRTNDRRYLAARTQNARAYIRDIRDAEYAKARRAREDALFAEAAE